MHPELELDALISQRAGGETAHASPTLAPLLGAARRLDSLRDADPAPDFARALEEQLLARVDLLAAHPASLPGAQPTAQPDAPRAGGGARRRADLPTHRRRLAWQMAAAAVLLFLIGSGATLRAAASSAPGSPLYGLRQVEQNVREQLAGSEAARARLHLQYADDALRALDAAVASQAGSDAYEAALATFQSELRAATDALGHVPAGADHDAIAAQVDDLSARARRDLMAALPSLGWPDRVATTTALGSLGVSVPQVTSATLITEHGAGGTDWRITISGSGFAPGAILLLNGQPLAAAITVTPSALDAVVENPPHGQVTSLGIGNPDGTAAQTANIQMTGTDSEHGHEPTATPGSDGNDGNPGKHGGHDATPTPTTAPHRP